MRDQGKWPRRASRFKNVDGAIAALPIELQRMALRKALRAAIEVRDFNGADRMLNEFETIGVPPEMEPAIAVLTGRLDGGPRPQRGRARQSIAPPRTSSDRRAAAQGRLREIVLRYSPRRHARART